MQEKNDKKVQTTKKNEESKGNLIGEVQDGGDKAGIQIDKKSQTDGTKDLKVNQEKLSQKEGEQRLTNDDYYDKDELNKKDEFKNQYQREREHNFEDSKDQSNPTKKDIFDQEKKDLNKNQDSKKDELNN